MLIAETASLSSHEVSDPLALNYVRHAAENINNVSTKMMVLETGSHTFPVSINNGDERRDNSYVVSPLTTYTGYADYELCQLGKPWAVWPLRKLVAQLGKQCERHEIDRVVHVNNWLLSTNLYPPDWRGENLEILTRYLVKTFPEHAIIFRSLNQFSNGQLLEQFGKLGYVSIPSRQVYLFDGHAGYKSPFLAHHNTQMDATLLRRTRYQIVNGNDLVESDYRRLEHLYNLLYLEKYCALNPQFTAEWLRSGQQDGWLKLVVLRSENGIIDGVAGWFDNGAILTAPVVGYDTALPQKTGLYRLLTQLCLQTCVKKQWLLNFSSGAAHFKRLRGGKPEIEYSMVYVSHLPLARQRVWHRLGKLLHKLGIPIIQRLKL